MQLHARDKEREAADAAAAPAAGAGAAAADLRLAARGSPAIGGGGGGGSGVLSGLFQRGVGAGGAGGGDGGGSAVSLRSARGGAGAGADAGADAGEADAAEEAGLDVKQLNGELLGLLEAIFEFLAGLRDDADMLAAVTTHAKFFSMAVHAADCGGVSAGDVLGHFQDMRATLLRLHVIKRTDFIPSGYSLMELLVWVTMALTCLAQFEGNRVAAYATVTMSALQFFYVIALLRDIDDPFDYSAETLFPSVEVDDDDEEGADGDEAGGAGAGAGAEDEEAAPPKRFVTMQGIGASAEIDQFPLIDAYARLARAAGVKMGRGAPPSVRDAQGRLVAPSVALAGLGGARRAAARADFSLRLRSRMTAAFDECDSDAPAAEAEEEPHGALEKKLI
jgi:hypothetical protein